MLRARWPALVCLNPKTYTSNSRYEWRKRYIRTLRFLNSQFVQTQASEQSTCLSQKQAAQEILSQLQLKNNSNWNYQPNLAELNLDLQLVQIKTRLLLTLP